MSFKKTVLAVIVGMMATRLLKDMFNGFARSSGLEDRLIEFSKKLKKLDEDKEVETMRDRFGKRPGAAS